MLDKALIGRHLGAPSILVEAGAVRNFARAIGETDPICTDVAAARAAGLPSLRVPPTFLFCLESQAADPGRVMAEGVGFLAPRATNQTEEGRQKNRRVEAVVTSTR